MSGQDGKEEKSLQGDIFPLSAIPDNWLLVSKRLSEPLSDLEVGPVHALHATLVMFKNLYYLNDERWPKIRDSLKLGLIKDTKKYGNTSVSMGAAKKVFENNNNLTSVGFLNCGTGGIKYQRYDCKEIIHVVGEHKPKDAASPNNLKVGQFKPKKEMSFEETAALLVRDLNSPNMPWKPKEVPMYAFVTGTIRQHWEEANPSEKKVLEDEMKRLFEPHGILPRKDSYFVTQDEEGALELAGAQALYANLAKFGIIEAGVHVVGSFGIGRGSCQWMVMQKNGVPELVGHKAGMVNVKELERMSDTLMSACKDPEKFTVLLQSLEGIANPAVALKSGAALMLDMKEYAHLKAELTGSKTYPSRTVRVATIYDKNRTVAITWTGSLDRLCAEAMIQLKSEIEFEAIYRDKDGTLHQLERNAEIKPNETLLLGPVVIHPTSPAFSPAPSVTSTSVSASTSTSTTSTTAPTLGSGVARQIAARRASFTQKMSTASCVLL